MPPKFDVARFEALKAEYKLLQGPEEDWSHLSMGKEAPPIEGDGIYGYIFDPDTDEEGSDDEGPRPPLRRELHGLDQNCFVLQRILRDLYSLARESENSPCDDFEEYLPEFEKVVNEIRHEWCSLRAAGPAALTRSLTHSKEYPLVRRKHIDRGLGPSRYRYAVQRMQRKDQPEDGSKMPKRTLPWSEIFRPHPFSTPFSRFRDCVDVTPSPDERIASAIYSARCEVLKHSIEISSMTLSPNAEVLLAAYDNDFRGTDYWLQFYFLGEGAYQSAMPPAESVQGDDPGHSDVISHITTEEKRMLLFSAERHRIKSFCYDFSRGAVPTHTFNSGDWAGPLATVASGEGKVIRAGEGSAGVWNLDTAPTHGNSGRAHIGGWFGIDGTSRGKSEYIEVSGGSPVDATITFEDPEFIPGKWHPHPSQDGVMLTAATYDEDCSYTKGSFRFVSIDLETGKFSNRYFGHGTGISQISTVRGQAQTFVTCCLEGYVRLWDTRMLLPALTITTGPDACKAVAYASPDGVPTIFTGATRGEHIRLWDIRARTPVYDLSTGNNDVKSLAWDHTRNQLWAATRAVSDSDLSSRLHLEAKEYMAYSTSRRWPERVHHWEDYFGVAYRAKCGRLFRYAFKEYPDVDIHP